MSRRTIRAGVAGWPVAHSRSPLVHGYWLRKYRIDGEYERIAIAPENFASEFRGLAVQGFAGLNVTVPHKQAAYELCDEVDALAMRLRAVNTVVIDSQGKFFGSNTDGFGFSENLRRGAPGWSAVTGPAVILGAGGAARAVIAALSDAGAPLIRVFNRNRARAEALARELGGAIEVGDWPDRARDLADANLLVNCTSLGMQGQPGLQIALDQLPLAAMVSDIVYTPLHTDLLLRAETRGNRIVDGLGMLLHQARPGFHAWFGVMPEVDAGLREAVLHDIAL